MLTTRQRLNYFLDAFLRRNEPVVCPSCGSDRAQLVDRKYLYTRLFECESCCLNFRHPPEIAEESEDFYQQEYVQGDGITTHLPSPKEVDQLRSGGFAAFPERSIYRLLPILAHCFPDRQRLKIVDYGASWGYMTYQFQELGHDVEGYEISIPRARFGQQALGVTIHTSVDKLASDYDLFFSSHVIEHVPNPSELIAFASTRVSEEGFCVLLCPNGSQPFRVKHPQSFHRLWGKVHPNLLTAAFFKRAFAGSPYFMATSPEGMTRITQWDRKGQAHGDDFAGSELFVVARPRMQANLAN